MNAYLFDVDGVLSDPKEKRVTEVKLFDQIISLLAKGHPVCLNTGRSLIWMEERIIDLLIDKLEHSGHLANFIAIGEKGGAWMTFDNEGNKHHVIDKTIRVPAELQKEFKALVEQKYSESMFFDSTKETMISIEMKDNFDIDTFHRKQKNFIEEAEKILNNNSSAKNYKIDPTIIATDVENIYVGKALGTKRFLTFLKENNLIPQEYIAFGDSKSDLEMADELERQGKKVTFIFVGDKEKIGNIEKTYHIDFVGNFTQGTSAYLAK